MLIRVQAMRDPGPELVRTGRTVTILATIAVLAPLGWAVRAVVTTTAPDDVFHHHAALSAERLLSFAAVPAALIATLVVICLNRVILHAVAWFIAGAATNFGELLATGAVANYIHVGDYAASPGDAYLSAGLALLAVGATKVLYDGHRRAAAARHA